ncbi:MAG: hypothetical protein J6Y25_00430 [Elusimicrobiaceae bacterium]|nr:hypothetical protein [Elusimicrobiaceae bacterium]
MKKIALILLTVLAYLPGWATITPLPEIQFDLIYNTQGHPLIQPTQSELVLCQDRLCMQAAALGTYGAQKFSCGPGACHATAYEFSPFARLVLMFEDGSVRTSQIFSIPDGLITPFNVYVNDKELSVQAVDAPPHEFLWKRPQAWGSLVLILILEVLCAAAYVLYTKKSFAILYGVAIANVVTTFITWGFLAHWITQSALLWVFCVVVEAVLIGLINRKDLLPKEAALLSVIVNVTSYTLGMIISFTLAQI